MFDDFVVKFDIEVSVYVLIVMKVYYRVRNVYIIFMLFIFVGILLVLKVLKFFEVFCSL